jgi:glutamate dehydrogenase
VPAGRQLSVQLELGRFAKRATEWFLHYAERPVALAAEIEKYRAPLADLCTALPELLSPGAADALAAATETHTAAGFAPALAARVALMPRLIGLAEVVRLARAAEKPPRDVARAYFAVGERFGLEWLRAAAGKLRDATAEHWGKMALAAIIDDLYGHQFTLARAVIAAGAMDAEGIEAWARQRDAAVAPAAKLIEDLKLAGAPDLAMLAVANRQLRALAGD